VARASTITTVLHAARGPYAATAPNELWTLDYKGQFRTRDDRWCYPLTVVDAASRFLLACVAHPAPHTTAVHAVLQQCFRAYGVPQAMLSDNGPPFGAPRAPRGFSRLTLRVRTLGIAPHCILPGHPEHNGRHERLHRTLKAEATRPPGATLRAQQARFDAFRAEYNTVRPHAALTLVPPARVFHPSTRAYVARPAPLTSPTHVLERRVTPAGLIWWHHEDIHVSPTFAGYTLGLDPVHPTRYDVYFAEYLLGTLDLARLRFTPLTQELTSPINPV
jgi:putative transposase